MYVFIQYSYISNAFSIYLYNGCFPYIFIVLAVVNSVCKLSSKFQSKPLL